MEELRYRLELLQYYLGVAWDKFVTLPTAVKGLVAVALVAVIAVPVVNLGSSTLSSDDSEAQTQEQEQQPVHDITMADLRGMSRPEAIKLLRQQGFTSITEQPDASLQGGAGQEVIVTQNPSSGKTLRTDATVELTYGSEDLYTRSQTAKPIPEIVGKTLPQAKGILSKEGFAKLKYKVEPGKAESSYLVTQVSPLEGTSVPLATEINLSITWAMDVKQLDADVRAKYRPAVDFAKIEGVKGRDITITLKDKPDNPKSQQGLDELARVHKAGIEQVLGQHLGTVFLKVPNVPFTGDSTSTSQNITVNGLTLAAAQGACEDKASKNLSNVKLDWETGTLGQTINEGTIELSAKAEVRDDWSSPARSVVIKCVVSNTTDDPQIDSFTAN